MSNEVHYSFGRTINTGNYESLRFDIGETRVVDDSTNSEEVYREIRKAVNDRMKAIMSKLKDLKGNN